MRYRSEIDGLRAIAVIPVILFHAGFTLFSGGYVGVDVFFVISGYLITNIILNELDAKKFSLIRFYERRARRIIPALSLVVAACLPVAWILMVPRDLKSFSQSLVAVSTFLSNVLFWRESGYFDTAAELKPLLHTWSLAVEEQYYIFFPLFMILAWPLGKRRLLCVISVAFIASLCIAEWGVHHMPNAAFYLLPTRGWELLIGAFTAFLIQEKGQAISNRLSQPASALGLLMILYAILLYDRDTPFPGLAALLPTVGTALIILYATKETHVHRFLSIKPLVGIGLISYSAYLWHQPILAFARYHAVEPLAPHILGALCALTLPLSYLSWKYVETPFRKSDAFSRRAVLIFSTLCIASFTLLGVWGHTMDGFPHRLGNIAESVARTMQSSPKRHECHADEINYRPPEQACRYPLENPSWAVVGDSHAVELSYALSEALEERKGGVVHFSLSGCAPSYRSEKSNLCTTWTNAVAKEILKSNRITHVVLSYRIAYALYGEHRKTYPKMPVEGSDAERKRIWTSYISFIKEMSAAGKTVIVVLQAPEVRADTQQLLREVREHDENIIGVPRDWWEKRIKYVSDRISDIPANTLIIDPADIFCTQSTCYAIKEGKSLYFDNNHMSLYGAEKIADEILKLTQKSPKRGAPSPSQ